MDNERIELDKNLRADDPTADHNRDDGTHEIAPDLAYKRLGIVNVMFWGVPGCGDGKWVLIDTGILGLSAGKIEKTAKERFGGNGVPSAIVMTHGHFDHIGGLEELAKKWKVPIFAHDLEFPYMNGAACYPPADPSVGGGLMALTSGLIPRTPIDVSQWLTSLPDDGSVTPMPGWQWLHTPGHTPGHVSLWRESDRTLIAGDAFVTTDQESVYAALTQKPEMQGPPMYFTQNWEEARASVRMLAGLEPILVVTGHGRAMEGPDMTAALRVLADNFDEVAVPKDGRYVRQPTSAEDGTAYTS